VKKLPPHILWPGIVVVLLCLSITMGAITVVAALRDPSFAVESDYYDKGLLWDEHTAQLDHNKALGWRASFEIGESDTLNLRPLLVELHDREGAPIEGAIVNVSCFHHAAANTVETLTLLAGPLPGQYVAPARITREGIWSFSLVVTASGELFTDRQKLNLKLR
jgi:nitrogen fixation protein FixH